VNWDWKYIHKGYYRAESPVTGDFYYIRTRPLNDGWMSINEDEGIVLATGQSIREAKETCMSYDKLVKEAIA
jgi:hypothetical protein